MLAWLLTLALLPGHSRSEGKSAFVLDSQGQVAISIQLGEVDLPDLCPVYPTRTDAGSELTTCLRRDLPRLLRVRGDDQPCPVQFARARVEHGVAHLEAVAACSRLPQRLVIDWGLFTGSGLDHTSVARIEQPHGEPMLTLLSRRESRVTVEVARPLWPWFLGAGIAVAAAITGVVWRWRRALARARQGRVSGASG